MFWITAIVVVAILIILSQIASVRTWASRVFGRVLPSFGALPSLGAIGGVLGGLPWARLAAIPLVLGAIWGIVSYIEGRGALKADLAHERTLNDAQSRVRDIEGKLAGDVTDRRDTADAERRARQRDVAETQQEIANAEDLETSLAAYRALRERLRGSASDHLARADADYLSSVAASGS